MLRSYSTRQRNHRIQVLDSLWPDVDFGELGEIGRSVTEVKSGAHRPLRRLKEEERVEYIEYVKALDVAFDSDKKQSAK